MSTSGQAQFELIFRPNVELVSIVRRFVSDFYERIIENLDTVSRLALATHELLENAVKYSTDGATTLSIAVEKRGEGTAVSIRIQNRAAKHDIARLLRFFEDMSKNPDPFAYYQQVIHQTAREPAGSGLGLARVQAEGEMTMTVGVDGEQVSIVGETTVREGSVT